MFFSCVLEGRSHSKVFGAGSFGVSLCSQVLCSHRGLGLALGLGWGGGGGEWCGVSLNTLRLQLLAAVFFHTRRQLFPLSECRKLKIALVSVYEASGGGGGGGR